MLPNLVFYDDRYWYDYSSDWDCMDYYLNLRCYFCLIRVKVLARVVKCDEKIHLDGASHVSLIDLDEYEVP